MKSTYTIANQEKNLYIVKGVSLAYVLKEKAGVTAENAEVNFETSDGLSN